MSGRPDAIVVGGGIVGAACARTLAEGGMRVLVLEASFAGGGTTAAGMGHLVAMDDSEPQFALSRRSIALWTELAAELPQGCEWDPCGTLWVAEDDEQLDAVRAKQAFYAERGVAAELLDEAQLAVAEPSLRGGLTGALRVPGDAVLYPPAAALHLLERARERGAELREGTRVAEIRSGAVVLENGSRLDAGVIVNAAGATAGRLTPGMPIMPRKGHLAITERYPGFVRHQLVELGYLKSAHVMTSESVAFNVQPRRTGQLLIGSSRELVGWEPEVNRKILRAMLRRALDFLPGLGQRSVIRVWTGFRPATPDKLPLIGPWEEQPGVWVAAGHEGLGITTSLGTAELIADLVLGRKPVLDPAPYRPSRNFHREDAETQRTELFTAEDAKS